jgi:hypothetical protein
MSDNMPAGLHAMQIDELNVKGILADQDGVWLVENKPVPVMATSA